MEQNNNTTKSLERVVHDTLIRLGTPPSLRGFTYITDAVVLAYNNPEYRYLITKRLYPEVAKMESTTPTRVERAIRNAIEVTWDRGNVDVLSDYFGYTIQSSKGKPTNSEFIAMIVLRLEDSMEECSTNV